MFHGILIIRVLQIVFAIRNSDLQVNQSDKNQSQSKSRNKTARQEDKNTFFHQDARVNHF